MVDEAIQDRVTVEQITEGSEPNQALSKLVSGIGTTYNGRSIAVNGSRGKSLLSPVSICQLQPPSPFVWPKSQRRLAVGEFAERAPVSPTKDRR
jgi:hypothetical protein